MEDEGGYRNTGLGLALGVGDHYIPKPDHDQRQKKKDKPVVRLDLSFTLCPKEEEEEEEEEEEAIINNVDHKAEGLTRCLKSAVDDQVDDDSNNKNNINNSSSRKKLRLTKEQSSLLEDSFKLHTTLNPAQKQSLAEQLNLKPRQVEVWFQNRRARTKLKQTEVDCEFLKKCCESLSDENRRLKKELQELRSSCNLKIGRLLAAHHLAKDATSSLTTTCPSCNNRFGRVPSASN